MSMLRFDKPTTHVCEYSKDGSLKIRISGDALAEDIYTRVIAEELRRNCDIASKTTHISGKYKFKRHNVFHGCRVDLAIFVNDIPPCGLKCTVLFITHYPFDKF